MQTQSNLEGVRNMTPIDTLIHMGAGQCSELDEYLTLQPRQLILIEANSQLAQDLHNRVEGLTQVQVSCVAIAGNPGPATFYRYNLPEVNSLHPASGLMDLFPGLKLLDQQEVNTISPVTLLEPLQLGAERENRLVIELPGEELPVLQALQQSQQLEMFSQVQLYCGREPLYEGSEPAARVFEWLREVGFDLIEEEDNRDPDRPCWTLRRNALQLRNRDLQRQLEQLTGKNRELAQQAADLEGQVNMLISDRDVQLNLIGDRDARVNDLTKTVKDQQSQLDQVAKERDEQATLTTDLNSKLEQVNQAKDEAEKLAADRKNQLDAAVKTRDELVADLQSQAEKLTQDRDGKTKLANEKQVQLEKVTKDRDEQAKLVTGLSTQFEQVNQAKDEAEKLATDKKNQLDAAVKTRDEQVKLVADLQTQTEMLTQDRDEHSKLANERQVQLEQRSKIEDGLKQELIDARQSASLSIRLQALREADLKDLQSRYQESQLIQENQHQLLVKLGERLATASNYFHQLANSQSAALKHKKLIQKTKKGKAKKKKVKQDRSQSPLKLSNKEEGED
jgi:hypothetical protein